MLLIILLICILSGGCHSDPHSECYSSYYWFASYQGAVFLNHSLNATHHTIGLHPIKGAVFLIHTQNATHQLFVCILSGGSHSDPHSECYSSYYWFASYQGAVFQIHTLYTTHHTIGLYPIRGLSLHSTLCILLIIPLVCILSGGCLSDPHSECYSSYYWLASNQGAVIVIHTLNATHHTIDLYPIRGLSF